ncbi:MAG: DNA-directed RNA polymerase subunit beta' [Chloroflexota bacterium]
MEVQNFDAIRISLASPEQIQDWSYGEVTKPETINYRTLRPERDGLFCERIFGPQKDWECACGKYKRVRYKGIICDKCGVEVAPARVRRDRMGHIQLASPVSHIWYVKGVPSRLGLLLNISPRHLERVLYFAQYIITNVNEDARGRAILRHERELMLRMSRIDGEVEDQLNSLEEQLEKALSEVDQDEEGEIKELDERINVDSSSIIDEAQRLQLWIQTHLKEVASEEKVLNWGEEGSEDDVPQIVIQNGEIISADHELLINEMVQDKLNDLQQESDEEKADIRLLTSAKRDHIRQELGSQIDELRSDIDMRKERLRIQMESNLEDLKNLAEKQLLTETRYRELAEQWGNVFDAEMGAEAVRDLVSKVDLEAMAKELRKEIRTTRSKQRRKKAAKRLRVVENFRKSGNRPEWMILTSLPVIPPDLRPMVQLDGGRFATSDLNDLYRRVINRNNRLHRLMELGAPDVIVRNEKRMLQEAVDSLVDNGRRGRAVSRSGKRKLKSLSDMLKGKQGRFRRNLLGKRVDYSGRSVIVIGPKLKLHQCGLPKKMALELFKPFVMRRLVEYNYAHNIKSAKRMVDRQSPETWDVLEEICKDRPVLLNRAPTLHRLGIQAFEVTLVEGSAIQLHPLTCSAFNADFDGDQMAVHVPLSDEAVKEARELMLSTKNLLKPSSGEPIVGPSKDMVMGVYYLTVEDVTLLGLEEDESDKVDESKLPIYSNMDEAEYAHDLGLIKLRQPIKVRFTSTYDNKDISEMSIGSEVASILMAQGIETIGHVMDYYTHGEDAMIETISKTAETLGLGFDLAEMAEVRDALREFGLLGAEWPAERIMRTTMGRIRLNRRLPEELSFINRLLDKKGINQVVEVCYKHLGPEVTADTVDRIKEMGFEFATTSGVTIAVSDIQVPEEKAEILERTTEGVEHAERQHRRGLITDDELYNRTVELWTRATDDVTEAVKGMLSPIDGLGAMAQSGSTKGGINPIRQLAGMRGLMADPNGRIIPLPIRSNFREGLTSLEYFLSTHGARKGLADTALRTADAGYLTRRLVDVAQDVIITEDDCGTNTAIWITAEESKEWGEKFTERITGRYLAGDLIAPPTSPEPGKILLRKGDRLNEAALFLVEQHGVDTAFVRSPLTCETRFGLCKKCYGDDLARGGDTDLGEAIGIIASQSIGEPGTQLTLRTFHTGGVAGSDDITQGLPRVEELFEARNPKGEAVIAEIDGKVDIFWEGEVRKLKISRTDLKRREVTIPADYTVLIDTDDRVQEDTVIGYPAGMTIELDKKGNVIIPKDDDGEPLEMDMPLILAGMDGNVFVETQDDGDFMVTIRREDTEVWEVDIPANARLRIGQSDEVRAGDQMTEGAKNPKEILRIQGREACQLYLLGEVQKVYRSQGVDIHDKHIEVVLRQLLRRIMVRTTGDTDLLPGELVDRFVFEDINNAVISKGGKPARGEPVVLGLTKAALNTESFLAAASFQETTRVLTEAAIRGQRDELRGLKENVIIGKLIPVGTGFQQREQPIIDEVDVEIDFDDFSDEDLMDFEDDLDLGDLDFGDLDISELTGVSELGMEPLMVSANDLDDEEGLDMTIDINTLKSEETEDIDIAMS